MAGEPVMAVAISTLMAALLKDDSMLETRGTLDVSTGAFGMFTQTFYRKIDDSL